MAKTSLKFKSHLPIVLPEERDRVAGVDDLVYLVLPGNPSEAETPDNLFEAEIPDELSEAEIKAAEDRWWKDNPTLRRHAENVDRRHREQSQRLSKLVRRMRALFRAYDCEPGNWHLLAMALAAKTGDQEQIESKAQNETIADSDNDFWRSAALELALKVGHFIVAPVFFGAGTPKADDHFFYDLRMEALLTETPDGKPPRCRSIADAARRIHDDLAGEIEECRAEGQILEDLPSAKAIEKDYHRRHRAERIWKARHRPKPSQKGSRIPPNLKGYLHQQQLLADLERAARILQCRARSKP